MKMRKILGIIWLWLIAFLSVCTLSHQSVWASDAFVENGSFNEEPAQYSMKHPAFGRCTTVEDCSKEIADLKKRLEILEKQILYISKQIGVSKTLANMVNEAKTFGSDAWDIAVEARAIAVRAEQKADKALDKID